MKTSLKWILLAVLLVAVLGGAGVLYNRLSETYDPSLTPAPPSSATTDTAVSTTAPTAMLAPDFTVTDRNGNAVSLSDYRGKPVVLNFWATWCFYCTDEMPSFQKAYEAYPDVQFLMVNVTDGMRETVSGAKAYIAEQGYTFETFYDTEQQAAVAYYVTSLPCTYFIDKDGHLVTRANGRLTYNKLEQGIQQIL